MQTPEPSALWQTEKVLSVDSGNTVAGMEVRGLTERAARRLRAVRKPVRPCPRGVDHPLGRTWSDAPRPDVGTRSRYNLNAKLPSSTGAGVAIHRIRDPVEPEQSCAG